MANESLVGRQLANFKVERLLGRGGMAEVYFGRDVNLQRPVAIKVIDVRFRNNPGYAERFISEARAVATWRHENIVQVYYAGKNEDLYYFVMEYIDGMDLSSLLHQYADSGELMPHEDVIQISKAVASALDYAHQRDVIHRDVKPANVMVSTDDRVVLMDFGLALDVQQGSIGEVFGTPHYVAPEQARRSADAVPESDVYSLGIMVYELLTGVVPFDDPSPTAVAIQHISAPPPSPRSLNRDLNQAVEDVLLKALAKTPDERYQSAMAFITDLEAALPQKADALATAELPPLPPGMEAPDRSMSSHTVAERVALNIQKTETQVAPQAPRQTASKGRSPSTAKAPTSPPVPSPAPPSAPTTTEQAPSPSPSRNRGLLLVITLVVVLLAVIGVLLVMSAGNGDNNNSGDTVAGAATTAPTENSESALFEATETEAPTESPTEIPMTATNIPLTATPIPPTVTPIPLTATPIPPTATNIPPTMTPLPPTVTIPPEPTLLYPNGKPVQLIWDDNSFYWYNPNGDSMRVSPIDFEALNASGNTLRYAFDGGRWTIGFSRVESGRCVGIEITQSPALRPGQCGGYNAVITPQRSNSEVFWLAQDGAVQFRVLWDGQEVGRCEIANQSCEVRVP